MVYSKQKVSQAILYQQKQKHEMSKIINTIKIHRICQYIM